MKNNIKIRLLAALLCTIMLFSAACTGEAPATQPAATESSEPTAPKNEIVLESPEDGIPVLPQNGARKIVSQTLKVYTTAEEVDEILFAHYEDTPEILMIDADTAQTFIFDSLLHDYDTYVIEQTETTLTITRSNGAYCILDFVEDSIYFNNFDLFRARFYDAMSYVLMSPYVDAQGKEIYFHRGDSTEIAGNPVYIDLAQREIPLDIYEGRKYIPFQTLNDLFLAPYEMNFVFNTEAVFKVSYTGSLDPSVQEMYYSVEPKERSEALANFTVNELCMVYDLYYGLQETHGITDGFESYLVRIGLMDDLRATDPAVSDAALATALVGYLADKHSDLLMTSPYTGTPERDYSKIKYDRSLYHFWDYSDKLYAVRAEAMPDDVPAYQEIGNTAYVTFDSFTLSEDRFLEYNEKSTQIDDTIGLIMYAHSMITREDSPIENVVLDLSCNSGGYVDSQIYVVAWMLGYCDFHLTNPVTNSYSTTTFTVDVNLDGVFDEKDTIADKNLYCIVSAYSFSAANTTASALKESEKVTLLGHTTGGGTCAVQMMSLADGSMFMTSSTYCIATMKNGAYYPIDRGITPHIYLSKFQSFFDREALTAYINNLK